MKRTVFLLCFCVALVALPVLCAEDHQVDTKKAVERSIRWMKKNNRFGPKHRMAAEMGAQLEREVKGSNAAVLQFGSGLLKSGTAQQLWLFSGQLFAFDLTADQAKQLKLAATSSGLQTWMKGEDRLETPLPIKLLELTFDNETFKSDQAISGKVSCRLSKAVKDRNVAVRLACVVDGKTRCQFVYPEEMTADTKSLPFRFSPLTTSDKRATGLTVIFIDVCQVTKKDAKVAMVRLSNSLATLIDLE